MALKREGPFEIEEVMGLITYQLKLPKDWKIHNMFHAVLLKPYTETDIHGENYTWPPPELLEEQEVYEVKTIIKHQKQGWGYQYFIKWKGYPIKEAMWEPESNISKDGNMLEQYKLQHQLWNQLQNQMPHTLQLSKSLISLKSLHIGWKVEFTLSTPFIKLWKQISIPLIIVSDPDGSHKEYKWLMDKRHKARKIKGKGKQHPFYNFNPYETTPLPELFPSIFYQTLMSINNFQQWKIHFQQAWLKSSIWLHKSITGYYLESKSLMFDSDTFSIPCPIARSRPSGITVYIQLCSKPKYYAHMASAFNTKESELWNPKSCNAPKTQPNGYLNPDIFITLFPWRPVISEDYAPPLHVNKKTHNLRLSAINITFTMCQILLVSVSTASSQQNHYWFTSSLEIFFNNLNTMSAMWDPECAKH